MAQFEFVPADNWNKWDARKGRHPATWEIEDVKRAMEAHARSFDVQRTREIFREVTGINPDHSSFKQLPHRHYGVLIAWYCNEMAGRPHKARV
jgi:hypothetical protein